MNEFTRQILSKEPKSKYVEDLESQAVRLTAENTKLRGIINKAMVWARTPCPSDDLIEILNEAKGGESMSDGNTRDCEHGQLRRSCEICALESQVTRLLELCGELWEVLDLYFLLWREREKIQNNREHPDHQNRINDLKQRLKDEGVL